MIDLPDDIDRFAKPPRIKSGGIERVRRLRAKPTHTEAKLWERLRKLDIRIRRQAPIGAYVVDFVCLRAKLVIEVDGGIHHLMEVALRDLTRDTWLADEGFRVLRIPTHRVEGDMDAVMAEIVAAIRQKAPLPLEGEGAGGWGGRTAPTGSPKDSDLPKSDGVNATRDTHRGSTPTQPSPLQGEGSE